MRVLVGGYAFRHEAALCGLIGADACFADAVALRDWLVGHRPKSARCRAPGVDALRKTVAGARRR